MCCVLELEEIFQGCPSGSLQFHQPVLDDGEKKPSVSHAARQHLGTHPFIKQLLARVLQTLRPP